MFIKYISVDQVPVYVKMKTIIPTGKKKERHVPSLKADIPAYIHLKKCGADQLDKSSWKISRTSKTSSNNESKKQKLYIYIYIYIYIEWNKLHIRH